MAPYKIIVEVVGQVYQPKGPSEWQVILREGDTVVLEDQKKYTVKEVIHDFPDNIVRIKVERKWD